MSKQCVPIVLAFRRISGRRATMTRRPATRARSPRCSSAWRWRSASQPNGAPAARFHNFGHLRFCLAGRFAPGCGPSRRPRDPGRRLQSQGAAATMAELRIPDLADKVFLVTGASTGIGAAVAIALGEQGAAVGVHYNASKAEAEKVAEAIEGAGAKAFLVAG